MDTIPIVSLSLIATLSGTVLFFLSLWKVSSYVTSREDLRRMGTTTVAMISTVMGIGLSFVVYLVIGLVVRLI